MEQLKKEIHKNGYVYKQLDRTRHAAFYEVFFKFQGDEDFSHRGYEAFKIRVRKESSNHGYDHPEQEIFPSNEMFSGLGRTFTQHNKEGALVFYNSIKDGIVEKTRLDIDYGIYKIVKYKNGNILVLLNGKVFGRPKLILVAAAVTRLKIKMEDAKEMTMKEISTQLFEKEFPNGQKGK